MATRLLSPLECAWCVVVHINNRFKDSLNDLPSSMRFLNKISHDDDSNNDASTTKTKLAASVSFLFFSVIECSGIHLVPPNTLKHLTSSFCSHSHYDANILFGPEAKFCILSDFIPTLQWRFFVSVLLITAQILAPPTVFHNQQVNRSQTK